MRILRRLMAWWSRLRQSVAARTIHQEVNGPGHADTPLPENVQGTLPISASTATETGDGTGGDGGIGAARVSHAPEDGETVLDATGQPHERVDSARMESMNETRPADEETPEPVPVLPPIDISQDLIAEEQRAAAQTQFNHDQRVIELQRHMRMRAKAISKDR